MNLKIVELMKAPVHDLGWLQAALQSAVDLELATLPPYLCGYWAVQDSSSYPATQILGIAMQEMAHFGLACNMLCAAGKQPTVLKSYGEIKYPGPLPGGVVPNQDATLIPWDPNFQVQLGFQDFKAFALMCARIEYPEDAVPRPALLAAETFPSIGQFYDAIRNAFIANDNKIPYDKSNQRDGHLGIVIIDQLTRATDAIKQIQQQGEGGSKYPYYAPNKLSHFYTFGELYFRKKYVFNAATQTGNWTGDPVAIPDAQIYNMTPVPLAGYSAPPPEVLAFDRAFTDMLTHLEAAWYVGGEAEVSAAIDAMPGLTDKATALLAKKINRTDAPGIYGPQFKIAT
jgi:hypothetical protein